MKKAAAYVRVSSKDQEREGFSIPAQKRLLGEYAARNALTVVKTFEEVETAKGTGRTQFRELVEFLKKAQDCRDLLVEKTDRLYRNFKDYVELDPGEFDLRLHFVKEGIVLDKDSRSHEKFIHGIKVLMAKNYIDNLSEEVKKGQTEKARLGTWPSWAPLGYLNKLDDHTIVPDPQRAPLIKRAFEFAASGQYSLSRLKRTLYEHGLYSKRAGKELGKQSMSRVLKNPIYYGVFSWNGKLYNGKHEPLISKQLFDRVQEAMEFVQKPKLTKHNFPYAGLLACGHCGCAVTAEKKWKKSGREYVYYHCTNGKRICKNVVYLREEAIEESFAAALKSVRLTPEIVEWTREALLESAKDERDFHESAIKNRRRRYQKLDEYISQAYEDKLEGSIEPDLWKRKTTVWRKEQESILRQISAHKNSDTKYLLEGVKLMELASRASELFRKMSPDEKRETISLVLSNPQVVNGSIRFSYKMPFPLFTNVTNLENWRGKSRRA